MTMPEKMLDIKEFARASHYSERLIRQYCIEGKIEGARKLSVNARKWLIPASALSQLKSQTDALIPDAKSHDERILQDSSPKLPSKEADSSEKPTNWIDAYNNRCGKLPPLPDNYCEQVDYYTPGQPISKEVQPIAPSGQWWNDRVPSEQKQWREMVEWLGGNPDDLLAQMRKMMTRDQDLSKRTTLGIKWTPEEANLARQHDVKIFEQSDAILSEEDIEIALGIELECIGFIGHSEVSALSDFKAFFSFGEETNKYINLSLKDLSVSVCRKILELQSSIHRLFINGSTHDGDGKKIYGRVLSESVLPEDIRQLNQLSASCRAAYKSYRAAVREILFV